MGYPMDYARVCDRNNLRGGYSDVPVPGFSERENRMLAMIAGDLRRLEKDHRDALHLKAYAQVAGCTEAQAKAVLDAFFEGFVLSRATVSEEGGL